ncbi:MAG: ATP-dependent sacrificial sulfur transferase LarE [Candidatus Omnitrophota bacterium]
MQLKNKSARLKRIIKRSGSCLIAFSGGTDSAFLLQAAAAALPQDKILAVTANSATYPGEELRLAKKIARSLGVRHKVIRSRELSDPRFIVNTLRRCYFCKRGLFSELKKIARGYGLKFVFDASNISDKEDFRPGARAKEELGIRSPLQEAGLSKLDIRALSKSCGLATWDKPSSACLASRIPYGTPISRSALKRVAGAEQVLRKLKFSQARVRHYGALCRIEVPKKEIRALLDRGQALVDKFKKLGYNYVTVDLEGYRIGSLNEVIK